MLLNSGATVKSTGAAPKLSRAACGATAAFTRIRFVATESSRVNSCQSRLADWFLARNAFLARRTQISRFGLVARGIDLVPTENARRAVQLQWAMSGSGCVADRKMRVQGEPQRGVSQPGRLQRGGPQKGVPKRGVPKRKLPVAKRVKRLI